MPPWSALTVDVPREHGEAVASYLFDLGSSGLEEAEQDGRIRLTAYFATPPPLAEIESYTRAIGAYDEDHQPSIREIDEQDWARSWRDHFAPLWIGARLFVYPPWIEERPHGRIPIVIDPGMAFGTGQHATTRMCLELIEALIERRGIARAIDLGSGSGILAIALAKLGVPEIMAVEIDPIACAAVIENGEANGVGETIRAVVDFDQVTRPAELLVANLYTNLLVELAPAIAARVLPGGIAILSGFVGDDAEQVERALCDAGFRTCERRDDEPWVALALERI